MAAEPAQRFLHRVGLASGGEAVAIDAAPFVGH